MAINLIQISKVNNLISQQNGLAYSSLAMLSESNVLVLYVFSENTYLGTS